ncbi:MAG: hypothetical protein SH859_06170 [Hyphomicrobium aestuarii]|nr:hypothetical protein [Hyphomicrobium aestuarii]
MIATRSRFGTQNTIASAAVAVIVSVAISVTVAGWIVFGLPSVAQKRPAANNEPGTTQFGAARVGGQGRTVTASGADANLTARFGFADPRYVQAAASVSPSTSIERKTPEAVGDHTIAYLAGRPSAARPSSPRPIEDHIAASRAVAAHTVRQVQAPDNAPAAQTAVDSSAGAPRARAAQLLLLNASTPPSATPPSTTPSSTLAETTARNPIIRLDLPRNAKTNGARAEAFRAELPIDLDTRSNGPSHLLIGRIPDGVRFSRGQAAGLGLWQMKVAEFRNSQIVVEASAPAAFQMTFMLLDTNSTVVNGLDVAFQQVDQTPPAPAQPKRADVITPRGAGGEGVVPIAKRWPAKTLDAAQTHALRRERKARELRDTREPKLQTPTAARLAGASIARPVQPLGSAWTARTAPRMAYTGRSLR